MTGSAPDDEVTLDDPRRPSSISTSATPTPGRRREDTLRTKANEVIDRLLAKFADEACHFVETLAGR